MSGTGEVPRRWLSEDVILAELETLNDTSMSLVAEYRTQAVRAAESEAAHKSARAKAVLVAKATPTADGKRRAVNEAELVAEADDDVSGLYLERLTAAALAEATREALRSVRSNQEALRTAAASRRDAIAGPGWSGRR